MAHMCRCGSPARYRAVEIACIECGTECCPCCTFMFESAPYCVACFETLLEGLAPTTGAEERTGHLARA